MCLLENKVRPHTSDVIQDSGGVYMCVSTKKYVAPITR